MPLNDDQATLVENFGSFVNTCMCILICDVPSYCIYNHHTYDVSPTTSRTYHALSKNGLNLILKTITHLSRT